MGADLWGGCPEYEVCPFTSVGIAVHFKKNELLLDPITNETHMDDAHVVLKKKNTKTDQYFSRSLKAQMQLNGIIMECQKSYFTFLEKKNIIYSLS